ncbi:MAG: hypothetical protein ABSE59_05475, partial [Opitutaceae bacterium]
MAAACLAAAGVVTEIPVLAYAIPAVISGVMAISVIWRFAKYKQNLSFLVLYAGTFLLFHFQLCSPAYWSNFTAIMPEYSVEARLLGVVGANLLPVAGVWTMLLLDMFC